MIIDNNINKVFIPLELKTCVYNAELDSLQHFYNQLFRMHPFLTKNERVICGFIKLDYSSSDISNLTGRRTHTVEVARVRLRKKLGITNKSISLFNYINMI